MTLLTRTEVLAAIRTDLSDPSAYWSNGQLQRCYTRALADFSRFVPYEKVYETYKEEKDVAGEHWTSVGFSTWVSLANKPIKYDSETVTDSDGAACTRGTDYYMDYANGKILPISGGEIGVTEADNHITYEKDMVCIDLAALTDLIRVDRVEYPIGGIPQTDRDYSVYGNILTVLSGDSGDQERMAENQHARIYYSAHHVECGDSTTVGTYPKFLEETIIQAAEAYALLIKAETYRQQVVTDTTALRLILSTTISHTALSTALGNIKKYLDNNSSADAAGLLAAITTQAADLRAAVESALDAALTAATTIAADLTTAAGSLTTGAAKIDTNNKGQNVAENYGNYAGFSTGIGNARINMVVNLISEAQTRINNLLSYIQQSQQYTNIATVFASEAQTRLGELAQYIQEADKYASLIAVNLELIDRYKAQAESIRNDVWSIWSDRKHYIGNIATASKVQSV